jgi:hypothetical protein
MLLTLPEWVSKGILFSAICSALRFHTTKTLNRHSGRYLFGSGTCAAGYCPYPSEADDLSRPPFAWISRRNLALPEMLESKAITQEEILMRTLLLAGVLAVAGFAIATPITIAPASAQVAVDTPLGGVRVGPQPRYSRDAYRAYGYDRGYRGGCRTVTIERDDGSVRRVRRCD